MITAAPPAAVYPPAALDGLKVLLVDDTLDALEAFAELLELEGAEVTAVSRPDLALQAATGGRYDLLISDIAMPGMDGYELLAQLRQVPQAQGLPAIALTGYGWGKEGKQPSGAKGFDTHLAKPVSFDTLLEAITDLLNARGN